MGRLPVLSTFRSATPRKRLWIAASAWAGLVLLLVIGNAALHADRAVQRSDLGHDFLAFYTAAAFVRDGRAHDLYNLDAVHRAEQSTAAAAGISLGSDFGPWWNPPFYALALEPLAALPYPRALDAWWWINLSAVAVAAALLGGIVWRSRAGGVRSAALVPLLIVASMPFVQAVSHGQNTCTSLLLLTATAVLWRSGRAVAAGVVGGLLFYKPQLAAVMAAVLAVDLGWAALGGLAITGAALLLATLLAMPGSLSDWVHQLPANVHYMQVEHPYVWDRHVTLKAFWRLLLQGSAAGEATRLTTVLADASVALVAAALAWTAWRSRGRADRRDRLIAATVCATPLLMPFYFDYDLLLLAVPLTLYAADARRDRRLTGAWVALYAVLVVNVPIAGATRVIPATIVLSGVTALSLRRVFQAEPVDVPIRLPRTRSLAAAA